MSNQTLADKSLGNVFPQECVQDVHRKLTIFQKNSVDIQELILKLQRSHLHVMSDICCRTCTEEKAEHHIVTSNHSREASCLQSGLESVMEDVFNVL